MTESPKIILAKERDRLQAELDAVMHKIRIIKEDERKVGAKAIIESKKIKKTQILNPDSIKYFNHINDLVDYLKGNEVHHRYVEWNGSIHLKERLLLGLFDPLPLVRISDFDD